MVSLRFLLMMTFSGMLLMTSVFASIDFYPFDDVVKEQRFTQLVEELRCPKCQNNNLADSNAGLAKDLKDIVYEKIQAGETNEQIIQFMKQRYGDFISYNPPLNVKTLVIWFGPVLAVLLGAFGIFSYSRKHHISNKLAHSGISQSSQQTLDDWANDKGEDEL